MTRTKIDFLKGFSMEQIRRATSLPMEQLKVTQHKMHVVVYMFYVMNMMYACFMMTAWCIAWPLGLM